MSWQLHQLRDLCAEVTSGGTPRTSRPEYYGGDIPWLRTQEVSFNRIADTEIKITDDGLANSTAKWIPENSVIVAMYGNSAGRVAVNQIPLTTNQACCNLIIDAAKADYRFIYYRLLLDYEVLHQMAKGAAQNNLNAGQIKTYSVRAPRVLEQERIADILSAYDDLIENNRRRMALLEDAARQLYREWFIRLRFPGHEHTYIAGGMPEGWKRVPLFDVAVPTYGHPFQSPLFAEDGDGLPVARIRDVLAGESKTLTIEDAPADRRLQNGDMLIGMDGEFHMGLWAGGEAWLNQRVVRIRRRGSVADYLLFNLLREPIRILNETITGTTVVHLGAKELKRIQVLLPPNALLALVSDLFEPLGKQIVSLKLQSRQLRAARDLLLPRLMTGEIAV